MSHEGQVIAIVVSFCFNLDLVFNGPHSINPILDCKESYYIKCPAGKEKNGSFAHKQPPALSPSLCGFLVMSAQEQQMSLATSTFCRCGCWKLVVLRTGVGQAGVSLSLQAQELLPTCLSTHFANFQSSTLIRENVSGSKHFRLPIEKSQVCRVAQIRRQKQHDS